MENDEAAQQKRKLRARTRAALREFSRNQAECHAQARRLCARTCRLPAYKRATVLLAFIPMPTEPDILPLVEQALRRDKKAVAVPRVQDTEGRMDFFFLDNGRAVDAQLQSGAYGIREPMPGLTPFAPEKAGAAQKDSTLVLVPGLLFGKDGSRLGQGGGYYDRYLRRMQACGFALRCVPCGYEMQFADSVPSEDTDMLLAFL